LGNAKDFSVEELTRLAAKRIKEGDRVVRKLEDFQERIIQKDPQAFKDDSHNLVREPIVHHHHHTQSPAPSSMLETKSSIKQSRRHYDWAVPDILIESAARRAKAQAEEGVEDLIAQAQGAISKNKQLVHDMGATNAKIRSLKQEFAALSKSDADDVATLQAEEAMVAKTKKATHHHAPTPTAASISNEELSLLEDAASKIEHKGARRVRAKIGAQSQKHRRRRKHGHP